MNCLLFGPPGAGKGTQSAVLVRDLGMAHLSTGDMFRNAIRSGTKWGIEAKAYMDAGALVPDEVVIGLVSEALDSLNGRQFVLDGFPRTLAQAKALEGLLEDKGLSMGPVVFLDVPDDILEGRLTGRRVCSRCGAVSHVDSSPTRVEGVCDVCGGPTVQRSDDRLEVVRQRLVAYRESTLPLRDYYLKAGRLVAVDGAAPMDVISRQVREIVSKGA